MRVPRLGVGVMTWGDMSAAPRFNPARNAYGPTSSEDEQREALEVSLAEGVNLFDTAAMYGKGASERRLGELAGGRDVLIATKFPLDFFTRAGNLHAALDGSLARLQRSTIDLYQIHFPSRRWPLPALMAAMADAVESGKIRAIGVSNFSAEQMRRAHELLARRGLPLASNQVQYSLLYRKPELDGVLDTCRELGITLIAYMPLASGALTGKYSTTTRPAGWRRYQGTFRARGLAALAPVVELLGEIGQRHDATPAQVALRWLIQQDDVLPIPGARNGRQAAANAGALRFVLSGDETEALSEATRAWRR